MAKDKLTGKQQRFIDEYMVDRNATQAAIRAGYSEKTAGVIGDENLKKPYIAAEIAKKVEKLSESTQINAEWVLKQAAKLHSKCMQEEPVTDREGNETGEYKFDSAGAARALDIVAKHIDVGAYKEKIELSGQVDTKTTIVIKALTDKDG